MTKISKNKVLFVIDTLEVGGAEKSLLENVSGFKDIEAVVCHIYKGDLLKQKFIDKGIKVYSLNITGKYNFLNAYKALKAVVIKEQPTLLVAYLSRSEIATRLVSRSLKIPIIGTFVSDLYCKETNQHLRWHSKAMVLFFKQVNKLMSGLCVSFVANSASIKDANAKHLKVALSKITVINRGRRSNRIIVREQPPMQENFVRFLNIGRLVPLKGQRDLILAFKSFLDTHPFASLHIAGAGPLQVSLQQLIDDNNLQQSITLLGNRNDLQELLHTYDCFVFPSMVEGFSGSVVEAMFAKVPVLASDIPANKEAITHMQTGYLFPIHSVQAIEEAMLWFINNSAKANAMAVSALEFAKQHFELDNKVAEFENYLQSALQSHA